METSFSVIALATPWSSVWKLTGTVRMVREMLVSAKTMTTMGSMGDQKVVATSVAGVMDVEGSASAIATAAVAGVVSVETEVVAAVSAAMVAAAALQVALAVLEPGLRLGQSWGWLIAR